MQMKKEDVLTDYERRIRMNLGIFSKTFDGDLETCFSKMSQMGIHHTQLNLLSAGMETMPAVIEFDKVKNILDMAEKYHISLDALSGTFNMINPNVEEKKEDLRRFEILCRIAKMLNIPIVTLCTGSRNPRSKWEWDEENLTPQAWNDLIDTTTKILEFGKKYNIVFGVETEASNIVNTPQKAREYLDYFGSRHLKIIMDGANLFLPSQITHMDEVLKEAFFLLGKDIVLAHAKDLAGTEKIEFVAAGEGFLNYPVYIDLLKQYEYQGAFIMHGLEEKQVPISCNFLRGVL